MRKHIVLIGCGRWGENILRDLLLLGCQVSVVDLSEERRTLAKANGASRAVEHAADLGSADGVIVATPATVHSKSIEDVMRFGCPVFVEKPLTVSLSEARRILDTVGDRVHVMDKWRYHAGIQELARIVETFELGRPIALITRRIQQADTQKDVDAVWTLAPHDLAIADEILKQPLSALAAIGERCSDGRVGLVGILRSPTVAVTIEVSACRRNRERRVTIDCEEGAAILQTDDEIVIHHRNETFVRPLPTQLTPLQVELDAFLQYIDGGSPPRGSLSSAVQSIALIESLRVMSELDCHDGK